MSFTPCLWFDTEALDAANFYVSIFPNSDIKQISYYGGSSPGVPRKVLMVSYVLDGNEFLGLNGGPVYKHSPAVSWMVYCDTQDEIDQYWESLLAGGGKESQCGWLSDKYGISWQITPKIMGTLMSDPDKEKSGRVMQAMMGMVKLDIAKLQEAYNG